MTPHPTPDQLRLWLDEKLDQTQSRDIEAHVAACPDVCQPLIDRMSGFDEPPPPPNPTAGGLVPPPDQTCPPGYTFISILGRGGMGTVWRATQLATRRQVALKITSARTLGSDRSRRRFEREVDLSARLEHPGIARLYNAGLHNDIYYYAMELIEGPHLDHYVRDAHLDQRGILTLMAAICRAVEHAHQRGVIHRDLKPSNILVTPDRQPHVVDFGLARTLEQDTGLTLTHEGDVAGTPAYMSPEQAAGRTDDLDTRTDVYSLGVILFRLLTGDQSPHDLSGTRYEVINRIVNEDARRPRSLNPHLDRELESLLLKALARRPAERYATAGALAQDIENYLSGEPLQARPATTTYFLRKRIKKYRLQVGLASAVALLLLAMAVLAYVRVTVERRNALAARDAADASAARERQTSATLEREGYFMRIALADQMERVGNFARADQLLDDCPPAMRQWEWYRLRHVAHKDLATLHNPTGAMVRTLAYSPDGSLLAEISDFLDLLVWDAHSHQLIWRSGPRSSNAQCMVGSFAFLPDGRTIAYNRIDGTQWLCEARTGRVLRRWQDHFTVDGWAYQGLALSPDGTRFAAMGADHNGGGAEVVRVRELSAPVDAAPVCTLRASDAKGTLFNCLEYSPDGKTIAGSIAPSSTVGLWDAATGHWLRNLAGIAQGPTGLTYSHRGDKIVTVGWSQLGCSVVDVASGRALVHFLGHTETVDAATFSPDDRLIASTAEDSTVRIWDAATARELRVLRGFRRLPNAAAFSPDGLHLATGDNAGDIKDLGPLSDGGDHVLRHPDGEQQVLVDMALSPDGSRIFTAARNGDIHIWDTASGTEIGHASTGQHVEFASISQAGSLLALGGPGRVTLWDTATRRVVRSFPARTLDSWSLEISPDARHLAFSFNDGIIQLWDLAAGSRPLELHDATTNLNCAVAFSPDSRLLATTELAGIHLWDATTGKSIRVIPVDETEAICVSVAFSPDCRLIAVGTTTGSVHIFETQSGHRRLRIDAAHTTWTHAIHFTEDGRYVLTGGGDKVVKIWELATGRDILTLSGHGGEVRRVLFTPDHRRIIASAFGDAVYVWDAGPDWPHLSPSFEESSGE